MPARSGETAMVLHTSGSVVLDGGGNGTIWFYPANSWQRWEVEQVVVSTSQLMDQSPYPTASLYSGATQDPNRLEGQSSTGNQDTFVGLMHVGQAGVMSVWWTGGIAATTAHATVTGIVYAQRW